MVSHLTHFCLKHAAWLSDEAELHHRLSSYLFCSSLHIHFCSVLSLGLLILEKQTVFPGDFNLSCWLITPLSDVLLFPTVIVSCLCIIHCERKVMPSLCSLPEPDSSWRSFSFHHEVFYLPLSNRLKLASCLSPEHAGSDLLHNKSS